MEILILVYAAFLSTLHFFFDRLSSHADRFHEVLLSYGAGSLLAIVFLILLPEAVHETTTAVVYPLILAGFVAFLLSEKYLYQHVKEPEVLEEELYHLHAGGFFADHFIKGFILVAIVDLDPVLGFLIAIPFLLHTLSSSIALREIHKIAKRTGDRILLSIAPVVGALTGIYIEMGPQMERNILAFVSGLMLFMVGRDVLPEDKEGRPIFFLLGVLPIFVIWLASEYLVA